MPELEDTLALPQLLETIEECLAERRFIPCLVLLYTTIDIVSSLEPGRATWSTFTTWVDQYLLPATSLRCTAVDLCGARCGMLHTLGAESDMSRKGAARHILYAWGNAKTDTLEQASIELGRENDCVVHVREFVNAFQAGLVNYLHEVNQDSDRKQKVYAGLSVWFTLLDQKAAEAFLEVNKG